MIDSKAMSRPPIPAVSPDQLRPAFSRSSHAFAFLLLLVAALAAPVVLARIHSQDRQDLYYRMRESDGAFSFARHEIFDVQRDVDILFVGNSTLWAGINTPIVEQALTQKLGRPARVLTFGSNWPGLDVPYMQVRDALDHKRIGVVVLAIPRIGFNDGPSPTGFRLLSSSDPAEATAGLPLRYRVMLYAGYVLRTPRDLLAAVQPRREVPSPYVRNSGAMIVEQGWDSGPFIRYTPPLPQVPVDSMIYSAQGSNTFTNAGDPLPPYHAFFLRQLAALLQAKGVKLVIASIPRYSDRSSAKTIELESWPALLGAQVEMVGVPPAVLFQGLTDADIKKFFYNNEHLNRNGNELYTRTITPAFLKLYDQAHLN